MPDQTTRPRRWKRLALASALMAAALVGSLTIASPASADTRTKCDSSLSSGNVNTCVSLSLSGDILTVDGWAKVINQGRTIQVCLNTPIGINCSRFLFEGPGQTLFAPSQSKSNPAPGSYCANTWRQNADGSHTEIGHTCMSL